MSTTVSSLLRPLLTIALYPLAIFLSACSLILGFLRQHLLIYGDTPLSTTAEKETAFVQSQIHLQPSPTRIKRLAWHCSEVGTLSNLKLREEYMDQPAPGYVTIKVHAIGLNFADIFAIQGLYSATPAHPFTPGLEFSGEVIGIPSDATAEQLLVGGKTIAIGDRVQGCSRFGAYATHLNASILCLKRLPSHWTYSEGASLLVQSLTAAYGLFTLGGLNSTPLTPDQLRSMTPTTQFLPYKKEIAPNRPSFLSRRPVVLIHSACGGVGLHALSMCLRIGAVPICTVSGKLKREYLIRKYKLPPEQVIDRSLCGQLHVTHVPAPPKPHLLSHLKYWAKSCIRVIISPIRTILDKTLCFRRKQTKDYEFLLDYALRKINQHAIDLSLDSLLGLWFKPTLQRMSCANSKVVVFGAASYSTNGDWPNFLHLAHEFFRRPLVDPMDLIPLNVGICGFNLIWLWDTIEELHGLLNILEELMPDPVLNITSFGVACDMIPAPPQNASTTSSAASLASSGPSSTSASATNASPSHDQPLPTHFIPNPQIIGPIPELQMPLVAPTSTETTLDGHLNNLGLHHSPASSTNSTNSTPFSTPPPVPTTTTTAPTDPSQHNNASQASFTSTSTTTTTTTTSSTSTQQQTQQSRHPGVLYKHVGENGFLYLMEAIKLLQAGQHIGKIVVTVKHDDLSPSFPHNDEPKPSKLTKASKTSKTTFD